MSDKLRFTICNLILLNARLAGQKPPALSLAPTSSWTINVGSPSCGNQRAVASVLWFLCPRNKPQTACQLPLCETFTTAGVLNGQVAAVSPLATPSTKKRSRRRRRRRPPLLLLRMARFDGKNVRALLRYTDTYRPGGPGSPLMLLLRYSGRSLVFTTQRQNNLANKS